MIHVVLILALLTAAYADQWEFFYPQTVTQYGCRVGSLESRPVGGDSYALAWSAIAWAKRNDRELGDWAMKIGQFPSTTKGRHQAEKICSQWQDEAEKRVNHGTATPARTKR